jgi:hypothetical protein
MSKVTVRTHENTALYDDDGTHRGGDEEFELEEDSARVHAANGIVRIVSAKPTKKEA